MIYLAINLTFIIAILVMAGFYKWAQFCGKQIREGKSEVLWISLQIGVPFFIMLNAAIFIRLNG